MDARLRDRIRLDSIMCVMDAAQVFAASEMMELKLRQIAFADMFMLNKADLVGREEIARASVPCSTSTSTATDWSKLCAVKYRWKSSSPPIVLIQHGVAIGAHGTLDGAKLQETFENCVAKNPVPI
jgi:hypothetical protein